MRLKTKLIAYTLAAAMVVTSAPANVTFVSAAGDSKKEAVNLVSWNKEYIDQLTADADSDEYQLSADNTELTKTQTFTGIKAYIGDNSYSSSITAKAPFDSVYKQDENGNIVYDENEDAVTIPASSFNEAELKKVINTSDMAQDSEPEFYVKEDDINYQWYSYDEKGEEQEVPNSYSSNETYAQNARLNLKGEDTTMTNDQAEKSYLCVIKPARIYYSYTDTAGDLQEDSFAFSTYTDEENPVDGEWTYKYTCKYDGLTAADFVTGDAKEGQIDIHDIWDGLDAGDVIAHYSNYEAYQSENGASVWTGNSPYNYDNQKLSAGLTRNEEEEDNLPEEFNANALQYKYKWTAYGKDNKEKVLVDQTEDFSSYIYSYSYPYTKVDFDGQGKKEDVTYFQVDVDYYYGYIKLGTFTKKFNLEYTPFVTTPFSDDPVTTIVRDDGKATMKVTDVAIYDSKVIKGYKYQWYQVNAAGEETLLDGETTSALHAKITDYEKFYVCRVTAKTAIGYKDLSCSKDVVFKFISEDGYLVKDISYSSYVLDIGEAQELFIKTKVDKNYDISYKWEKLSSVPEVKKDENNPNDEGTPGFKVKKEVIGTDASVTIKAESEEDFVGAPRDLEDGDFYSNDDYGYFDYANYKLSVVTRKGNADENIYEYFFKINQKGLDLNIDTNSGTVTAVRGKDTTLYAYTDDTPGYRVEKKWYKYVDTKEWTRKTYRDPDDDDLTPDETADLPKDTDTCEDPDFKDADKYHSVSASSDGWWSRGYDSELKKSFWTKKYTMDYYTEVTASEDGSECVLPGMSGSEYNDDRLGEYRLELNVYKDKADENDSPYYGHIYKYDVTYDSELTIYAKNDTVKAAVGTTATLQVVANNNNKEVYPISYQWAKKNEDGYFEDIEGANSSVLNIENVSDDDYGMYSVTVKDPVYGGELGLEEEKNMLIELQPAAAKVIVYTPKDTYYNAYIGDTIKLTADMDLEDGIKPFYAWYRAENIIDEDGDKATTKWELLNQDSNTYELKIDSDDDYTDYYCEVSYLTMRGNEKISVTKKFNFYVNDNYYFELQKLTPATQYKSLGSSASYSVKILTDNPKIKDSDVKYQWFTYDEDGERVDIKDANKTTYTIDKLAKEDFGSIYVEASVDNKQDKYTVTTEFETYQQNEAELDGSTNDQTLQAKLGDDITLMKPVIKNGKGYDWTYQWYYFDKNNHKVTIYGATDAEYTIKNIGENEFRTYYCEISCDDTAWGTFRCTVTEESDNGKIFAEVAKGYKEDVEAVLGRNAAFSVRAVSKDKLALKYQWYKLTHGTDRAIGGATDSSYKIDVVTPESYGTYKCEVMDENGNSCEVTFTLSRTYELEAETEAYDSDNTIGYEVSLGSDLTINTHATCAKEYKLYYDWYKYDKESGAYLPMEKETGASLTLKGITRNDLGNYKCEAYVYDEDGEIAETISFYYKVYVNTGLVVVPDCDLLLAQADGSVKMHVQAKADADQEIAYEWSKYTLPEDEDDGEIDWDNVTNGDNDNSKYDTIEGTDSDGNNHNYNTSYAIDQNNASQSMAKKTAKAAGEYKVIKDAKGDTYTLPAIKNADYGTYRCVVYTSGETYTYYFYLNAYYAVMLDRGDAENVSLGQIYDQNGQTSSHGASYWASRFGIEDGSLYAEEGDTVTATAKVINPAADMNYTYEWYAKQSATGTMKKVEADPTASTITQTVPKMIWSDNSANYAKAFATQRLYYGVVVKAVPADPAEAAKLDEEDDHVVFDSLASSSGNASVKVITPVNYDNSKYPETTHPFDQVYNVTGFTLPNDGEYVITFSDDTDADLVVVDDKGTPHTPWYDKNVPVTGKSLKQVTISGTKAIFVTDDNEEPLSYGYKVLSIKKKSSEDGKASNSGSGTAAAGAATPGAVIPSGTAVTVKKGAKVTVNKLIYTVTKVSKKNGTVALTGVKASAKKSLTNVTVPASVKIKGTAYKVTAVNAKALSGLKKLKKVVIGKNITKIGANAFNGDKKLKNISIKSKNIKSIGAKAFKGVPAKAKVSVPAAKKKTYKKLLKKAGLKKAKIK